jgi:hypothetical protein
MCPRLEIESQNILMASTTTPEPSSVVKTCSDTGQLKDGGAAATSETSNLQKQPNAVASSSRVKLEDVLPTSIGTDTATVKSEVALGKRRCDFTQDDYALQADRV